MCSFYYSCFFKRLEDKDNKTKKRAHFTILFFIKKRLEDKENKKCVFILLFLFIKKVRRPIQLKAGSFYYSCFLKRLEDKDNKKNAHFTILVFL
jgi:hypothetical protein